MLNRSWPFHRRAVDRPFSLFLSIAFSLTFIIPLNPSHAQNSFIPVVAAQEGVILPTPAHVPVMIKGIEVDPANPLLLDFIIDAGDSGLDPQGPEFRNESLRLIKYFLAALTVPEEEVWVNLSPDEESRIIPEEFGRTVMGMDLLEEDALLKQLTASLMYPEQDLGRHFWDRIHARLRNEWEGGDIETDAFHRVWIVPKDAEVLRTEKGAFILNSALEVMMEEDYFAMRESQGQPTSDNLEVTRGSVTRDASRVTESSPMPNLQTELMRELILPEIAKEVNEGASFARLRQIYNAMILATWFKIELQESLLGMVYADRNKVAGVTSDHPDVKEEIYGRYIRMLHDGVYNYIREEADAVTGQVVPRQYFAGGFSSRGSDGAMLTERVSNSLLAGYRELQHNVLDHFALTRGFSRLRVRLDEDQGDSVQEKIQRLYPLFPEIDDAELLQAVYSAVTARPFVIHDVTLEAILPELDGNAQTALGKGGLGFLAGETLGAYKNALGFMPLYHRTKSGIVVDWDKAQGIRPVYVKGPEGQRQALVLDLEMGGRTYATPVYWVNRKGTPVFLFRNAEIFDELYPDPDTGLSRTRQYGLMGKAYEALANRLGIALDILRLNEAQLVFVQKAVENDIAAKGEASLFARAKTVMTNHTPERAALPVFGQERWWLEDVLGLDLVSDEMYLDEHGHATFEDGRPVIRMAEVLARKAFLVTTVSEEHGEVTKRHVLPRFAWKTAFVQNGSDPDLWHGPQLEEAIFQKGFEHITGEDLFAAGQGQKAALNQWLQDNGFYQFTDLERPLFAAVRRILEYKEQGIFIPMVKWITGDADQEYDTPWGKQKGLAANFLIGGPISDNVGAEWAKEFKNLQNDPEIQGKLVFIDKTGTDIMRLSVSAADVWLESPRPTREASGTSHQRALLNGKLVIASFTGGQLAVVRHRVNSWLVDVFQTGGFTAVFDDVARAFNNPQDPRHWEFVERYRAGAQQLFGEYMTEAVGLYNAYRNNGDRTLLEMKELAFFDAHEKISIEKMINDYEDLFYYVLVGSGAAGYESRQIPAAPVDRAQMIKEYLKEQYSLGDHEDALEAFLLGWGPALDAVHRLREGAQVDHRDAEGMVISAWITAAYGLDPVAFESIRDFVLGQQAEEADFSAFLSEEQAQLLWEDAESLQTILATEDMLRQIDQMSMEGREVPPGLQYETRGNLAQAWQSLAQQQRAAQSDPAMLGEQADPIRPADVGGIDLNRAFLDLTIRRDGRGMPLPAAHQNMDELMMVPGFLPVIIQISPVNNLPMLLGLADPLQDRRDGPESRLSRVDRMAGTAFRE